MGLYIQFGAGFSAPNGWLNFDSSPTLMIEKVPIFGKLSTRLLGNKDPFPKGVKYGNIVKGLPVENGTADGLYGSHVLEHLSLDDMRKALVNCHLMLKPGGIIRIIVPDLFERASRYVLGNNDESSSHEFIKSIYMGKENSASNPITALRSLIGNSSHLWMFDYNSMAKELENAGFTSIRRAGFGDSEDRMFDLVEDPTRFIDGDIVEVAIEAKCP